MTTGTFNGTNLIVKWGDKAIGHTTSCTLSLTADLPDATTKDSAGWAQHIQGLRSGTISVDGLVDYSDDGTTKQGAVGMADLIINRTSVSLYFGTETVGDTIYTCTASLGDFEQSAEMEAPVSFSGTFVINGAITKATLT